jgi:hypothetical protein
LQDIERLGLQLSDGMILRLFDGEIAEEGTLEYSIAERMWVVVLRSQNVKGVEKP